VYERPKAGALQDDAAQPGLLFQLFLFRVRARPPFDKLRAAKAAAGIGVSGIVEQAQ
jgi:hypothetical protein